MSGATPPPTTPSSSGPGGDRGDDESVAEAAIQAMDSAVDRSMDNVDAGARYQARIALVTAIVALVSALLGPLVSLKINSDQIKSQRDAGREQNASEQQQSSSEFIRGQRQTAYGDYLAAYNNSALDLLNDAGKFSTGGYPVSAITKDLIALVNSLKEVSADFYTVTLVGSKNTVSDAVQTYTAFSSAANVVIDFGGRRTRGESISAADVTAFEEKTKTDYNTLVQIGQTFINQARKDLDADSPSASPSPS